MRPKWTFGVAASLFLAFALPAWANDAQQRVETCLRSASLPDSCGPGRLEVDVEARVSPSRLPRRKFAPVALTIGGTVGAEGGGHPSALREAMVTLDEGPKIDTNGLAACPRRRLERLDVAGARKACQPDIRGVGPTAQLPLGQLSLSRRDASGELLKARLRQRSWHAGRGLADVPEGRARGALRDEALSVEVAKSAER
ncbi:MAG: hypothetical protein WAM81_11175 [Acidimicrobiia bacterium]